MPEKSVDKAYQEMIEQIKIDQEKTEEKEMKEVYKEQKVQLDKLNQLIALIFIKYSVEGLIKVSPTQKASVMNEVKNELKIMGKALANKEISKVTFILGKAYLDTYYKSAFIIDSGMKIDLKFDLLKKEYVNAAVNSVYKEALFSDRIWKNKASMIDKLQGSIIETMKGKTHLDKVTRDIRDTFSVQANESQRLVRTENARVQAKATDDIAMSSNIKKQMYNATLDMRTNPKDASFDGNIYDVDDMSKPNIPLHPNCRCCYINMPSEDWKPSTRRDNETKEVIDYKNYATWLKDKGVED